MSRYIDTDALKDTHYNYATGELVPLAWADIENAPHIDIVRCKECRKSHIDGKTTHYLWCTEWGRSTDVFGYCERGKREGE